jgi:hypothetical protein
MTKSMLQPQNPPKTHQSTRIFQCVAGELKTLPLDIFKHLWRDKRTLRIGSEDPDPGLKTISLDIALRAGKRPVVDLGANELPVRPLPTGEEWVDA